MPRKGVPAATELGGLTIFDVVASLGAVPAENGCAADVDVAAGVPLGRGTDVVVCAGRAAWLMVELVNDRVVR